MTVKLKKVRLSYPKLFVAEYFDERNQGTKRYSASFHIEKTDVQTLNVIKATIFDGMKAAFGAKAAAMLDAFKADKGKYCLKDGDKTLNKKGEPIAPGCFVLSAHRQEKDGRPGVFDRNRMPLDEKAGRPYAGCYVNASVDFWVQEGQYAGVRCSLLGVQFAEDGEAFGGAPAASQDDFEDLAGEYAEGDSAAPAGEADFSDIA